MLSVFDAVDKSFVRDNFLIDLRRSRGKCVMQNNICHERLTVLSALVFPLGLILQIIDFVYLSFIVKKIAL